MSSNFTFGRGYLIGNVCIGMQPKYFRRIIGWQAGNIIGVRLYIT